MPRNALDRPRIVAAARDLLDEGGLEALTARALADRLGVRAGALYYHLPHMRALLDEVATDLLREAQPEQTAGDGWEATVRDTAHRLRTVLNRHRDGARVVAGSRITDPALLVGMGAPLAHLCGAGLPIEEAFWSLAVLRDWVVGFVIEEQHRRYDEPEAYRPELRLAAIDASAAPFSAAATGALHADPDRAFGFGLDVLVEGVRARIGQSPASARATSPSAPPA